jgi:GT2 family glycosyltransferase
MLILIVIPSAKYVETNTFVSVYNLDVPEGVKTNLAVIEGYSVDTSRNLAVKEAKEQKADYILWVDSDMLLPKDTLTRLLSHSKDIVSGAYAFKDLKSQDLIAFSVDNKRVPLSEIDGLTEVGGIGFGCCLTKTDIFKKIEYPYFVFGEDYGEDIYFCRKARAAGYKIYLDPDVKCGHIGKINFQVR